MDNISSNNLNITNEYVYLSKRGMNNEFLGNKKDLLIVVFLSAVGLYLIVSIIIYFASYIIKNKGDAIAEEFLKEMEKRDNEENHFFMNPNIPNTYNGQSPKAAEAYKNLEKDYNSIWDDMDKKKGKRRDTNSYPIKTPITTPVSFIEPTPDMRYSNDFSKNGYNSPGNDYGSPPIPSYGGQLKSLIRESTDMPEYNRRISGSTTSSTASVTNLITKDNKSEETNPNIDEVRPRTSSESRRSRNIKRPPRNLSNEVRTRASSVDSNRSRANSNQQIPIIQVRPPSVLHKNTSNTVKRSSQIRFSIDNQKVKSPNNQPLLNYTEPSRPPSIPIRQTFEYQIPSNISSPPPSQRNPIQRISEQHGINLNSRY